MAARPHPRQRLVENLQHGQDRRRAERRADGHRIDAGAARLQEPLRSAADAGHEPVPEHRQHLLKHAAGVGAPLEGRVERGDCGRWIAVADGGDEAPDPLLAARSDHGMHVVDADRARRRAEQLLEERLAVAHAAGGPAGDEVQRLGRDLGPFRLDDLRQPPGDRRRVDRDEVEPLAAREDRDRELVGLGRAEHELDVARRLLQRLEQCVEGLAREHVDFVDDVDLEAAPRRPHRHVLAQLPDLVDAAVARRVDLDDVHVLPGGDRRAGVAGIARFRGRPGRTLQCLGEDPRRARLAHAAGAGEQVGVADPARRDRAGQAAGHVLLADEVGEQLRPIAPGHHLVSGRRWADVGRCHEASGRKRGGCRARPPMRGPPHKGRTAYGCCG